MDNLILLSDVAIMLSCLISGLVFASYFKLSTALQLLGIYLVCSASFDLLSLRFNTINNLKIYHFYTFLEFLIVIKTFQILSNTKKKSFVWTAIMIIGLVIMAVYTASTQNFTQFNSHTATFSSIVIIFSCLYFFVSLLDKTKLSSQEISLKWVIVAIFCIQCVNVFFYLFSNYLVQIEFGKQKIIWFLRIGIILLARLIILGQFGKILFSRNSDFNKYLVKEKL